MSIIDKIYLAPIVESIYNEQSGITTIVIEFNNKKYIGSAFLHKDDKDFYSQKVGKNIALSHARIAAMQDVYSKLLKTANEDWLHYCRIVDYNIIDFEHKNLFYKAIRSMKKAENIKKAILKEKNNLKSYLINQDKVIKSVKRLRNGEASHYLDHAEDLLKALDKAKKD